MENMKCIRRWVFCLFTYRYRNTDLFIVFPTLPHISSRVTHFSAYKLPRSFMVSEIVKRLKTPFGKAVKEKISERCAKWELSARSNFLNVSDNISLIRNKLSIQKFILDAKLSQWWKKTRKMQYLKFFCLSIIKVHITTIFITLINIIFTSSYRNAFCSWLANNILSDSYIRWMNATWSLRTTF